MYNNPLVMILAKEAPRIFGTVLNTFEDQVIVKFRTGEIKQYHKNEVMRIY